MNTLAPIFFRRAMAVLAAVLMPAAAPGAEATNSTASSFLPAVERVMDAGGILGARVYLNFESGAVTAERLPGDAARNRRLHRDLMVDLTPGSEEWTGVDLQVAPASEELWDAPADRVMATLADELVPPLATMQVTPGIWFFKTREGRCGLLRVVGFVEPRQGDKAMKVVYKLVRPGKSESPPAGPTK